MNSINDTGLHLKQHEWDECQHDLVVIT